MNARRLVPPALLLLLCAAPAALRADDPTRRDLLTIIREQPGSDAHKKAARALTKLPSPLDRLSADAIPEADRKFLSVSGLVGLLHSHGRAVASLAFTADGTILASSGWDNTVRLWRLGDTAPKEWATLDGSPSGLALHPTRPLLAAGGSDTRVHLWDLGGPKPKVLPPLAGHQNRPFATAIAPDGKHLASGCLHPVLRVWKLDHAEPEAWAVLANETAPSLGIASLAFSHDGKQTLRLWAVDAGYLEEKEVPTTRARLVACSPTDPVLAFSGDDGKIHLWSLTGPPYRPLRTLPGHAPRALPPTVRALAFAPTGDVLASGGPDHRLRLWDVATGEKVREWQLRDEPRAFAFAADGRHLAVGNNDGSIYLLRLASATMDD